MSWVTDNVSDIVQSLRCVLWIFCDEKKNTSHTQVTVMEDFICY